MKSIALTGLLKIELPERTLRFSDGGFITFQGEVYRSKDAVFGTIGAAQPLNEGVGDSVPALQISLLPPDTTGPAALSRPGHQKARVRFWVVEYDPETSAVLTSDQQFDGQVDQTVFTVGRGQRELTMSIVSLAERLFEGNIGNSFSPTFHKSIWPGELGHDNASGLSVPVAWGVEAPAPGNQRREQRKCCLASSGMCSGQEISGSTDARTRKAAGRHGKDARPLPGEGVRLAGAGSPASTMPVSTSRT